MEIHFVEVTNGPQNWGKFLLMRFDHEWQVPSQVGTLQLPLLRMVGWNPKQIWVLDLQTCEGAAFFPRGIAAYDLEKHRVWVCPMFEPFLTWLYQQKFQRLNELPNLVDLPDAEFELYGHRRAGKKP